MFHIRPACDHDIPGIKKVGRRNKKFLGPIMDVYLKNSLSKSELHVACAGRHIVGFIRWHFRRDGWATIYQLCVSERVRRQGLGKRLIAVAGTGPVQLKCRYGNPALHFYRSLGFRSVGREVTPGGVKLRILKRNI